MSIKGYLTDFSFPEICRFIEKGKKTGLLTITPVSKSKEKPPEYHYIWVCQGKIVAAANRLDDQGLTLLLRQQEWVSDRILSQLLKWCCPKDQPLGTCLKNHRVLTLEQLEQLFLIQVCQQVSAVSKLKDGLFTFRYDLPVPARERTGLSMSATEATLLKLSLV